MLPPLDLASYDHILVAFSGGKDSVACFLALLEAGVNKARIELWHHGIDGRPGTPAFMDWPCTPDYCRKFAQAWGVPIYFSWREGGFEREMLRENSRTAPAQFETPEGLRSAGGQRGTESTRRKLPQVSADLSVRWCSSSLKIEVCTMAIRNQPRFDGQRTLVVTGERAEESSARAKYKVFEPHRASCAKRHVDSYRAVHHWKRTDVWDIIQRHKINPHPAYRLGWGRVSCMICIFGSDNQFASVKQIAPAQLQKVADYEREFGVTIKPKKSVPQLCAAGQPYDMKPGDIAAALSETFEEPIFIDPWVLPAGAFGETAGPS